MAVVEKRRLTRSWYDGAGRMVGLGRSNNLTARVQQQAGRRGAHATQHTRTMAAERQSNWTSEGRVAGEVGRMQGRQSVVERHSLLIINPL